MFRSIQDQDKFFEQVAHELEKPANLFTYGGTAMIYLGEPGRVTLDVDVHTAGQTEVRTALERVAESNGVKVDDFDPDAFVFIPPELLKPATQYRQFGNLTVYVVDPHRIAVDKLDRAAKNDIKDVQWLLENGLIQVSRMQSCIEAARDVEDRSAMHTRFAEIAGLQTESRNEDAGHAIPARNGRSPVLIVAVLLILVVMVIFGIAALSGR